MPSYVFLFVALVGLVCSTGFVVLLAFAAVRFSARRRQERGQSSILPPVTLLKPLCGMEPNLRANLESFFRQDYPNFEIVFGTRNATDPALNVVRELQALYPRIPVRITFSGEPDRPNAKVCSLEKMYTAASHDFLVISDSDVHVRPEYIREVVRPLLESSIGLVTCLYEGVPTGGFWSHLEALGMSVEMTSGVVVADLLEGMTFALGPTMATRRDVVDKIGGFGILAAYCADDYVLGNEIYKAGYTVVLSSHIIEHVVLNRSFKSSMLHQARWMKSSRFSRSAGHIGTVLTFAMPFGILGAGAALVAGLPLVALAVFGFALFNRLALSIIAGWVVVRDRRALTLCWLYPVRDLMGFGFWCASFFGREIVWRNERYRLEPRGLMVRVGLPPKPAASGPVAVDDLV